MGLQYLAGAPKSAGLQGDAHQHIAFLGRIFGIDQGNGLDLADLNPSHLDRGTEIEALDRFVKIGFQQDLFLEQGTGPEQDDGQQGDTGGADDKQADFKKVGSFAHG